MKAIDKAQEAEKELTIAQAKKAKKNITDKHIKNTIKLCEKKRHPIGDNLYLQTYETGKATWAVRYSYDSGKKNRPQKTIGRYGIAPKGLSLKEARKEAAKIVSLVDDGKNPKQKVRDNKEQSALTVAIFADQWLKHKSTRIENPQIPARILKKDILPIIGEISLKDVQSSDILDLVENITSSGRPTIANDALGYCKQIFKYAILRNHIRFNPAAAISQENAGGREKARTRNLRFDEIEIALQVMRENKDQFTRENYIAVCLLLALGVRKCELIAAPWSEFELEKQIWMLPEARTKRNASSINIPLPDQIMPFLKELKVRACGSDYLFPARRTSKRRGYISDDTLNHALNKLFGIPTHNQKKRKISPPNLMGEAGVTHFIIHDLRRTCRTRLSELDVQYEVKEIILNHALKGIAVVYDGWQYFDKRKDALTILAKRLEQYW
ncbi:MAG: integrase arm-type DNA-binding domain-containing protein [Glaciecola sp.]